MIENETNILVGRKKLEWIAISHQLSTQAKTQMIRRDSYTNSFEQNVLRDRIRNSPLAWKIDDKLLAIALDLFTYIVVDPTTPLENDTVPTIVTFIDTRSTGENVTDKMLVAYKEAYTKRYRW